MTTDESSLRESGQGLIDRIDQQIDQLLDPLRSNSALNHVFYSASALADHSVLWFLIASALALTERESRRGERAFAALAVESGLVNLVIKTIFRRKRPVQDIERPLPLRQPLTSSFPSGHATAATCAAILLSHGTKFDRLWIFAAALVAYSRLHVRIHHASDVAGGVLIGALYAQLVKRVFPI
jgi:undecaprenyl-diphosphatase